VTGPPLSVALWLAAFAPVVVLFALVVSGRVRTQLAAVIAFAAALVLAVGVFQAASDVVAVGVAKGLWLGVWILYVVWPALLLYRIASVVGIDRLGEIFTSMLSRRRENLLIVAWIFPSFIQGVAGFGTPIAVTAPLLVAMGWPRLRAVVYPLIGYHWSVTFGSMGSSFYMAALTGGFGGPAEAALALRAALLLGVSCLVAGALVLLLDGGLGGLREGARLLLLAGLPMAATLVLVARIVPAVASLAAGAVGLAIVALQGAALRRRDGAAAAPALQPAGTGAVDGSSQGGDDELDGGRERVEPARGNAVPRAPIPPGEWAPEPEPHGQVAAERRNPVLLLSPYLFLLATALPVFLVPASRAWVRAHLALALALPATQTGYGWRNAAVVGYQPLALLGHPGTFILLACLLGYLTYRVAGLWQVTDARRLLGQWARSLPAASVSILVLAALATLLVDAGMVSVLARGAAEVAAQAYPLLAPSVGALGSFMTGSSTSSNALFSALQADVAGLLRVQPEVLVAAQAVGANIGNSLAPVVLLIGATSVGEPDLVSRILRTSLAPAAVLLAVATTLTFLATL
jgi:lactate permease